MFRPSDVAGRPVDALAAAILSEPALPEIAAGGTDVAALAKMLGENPEAVAPLVRLALARVGDTARAALPPGSEGEARLALVIDQFEEIFTQEGVQSTDRAAFVSALKALAASGQVWVVATMRADFYPRCQDLPPVFLELCPREAVFELMPPTPEEISQMIRRPARLAGLEFERRVDHDEGLDDVLRDAAIANPGSLPLLQFALDELYTRAGQGRVLRFADYEQMGRLEGALQERAETELKALTEDAQAALPLVLSHLVQLDLKTGAIAQRRLVYARVATDPHCRALIDRFVDKRLFERDRGSDGEAVIGVAHEALLRSWTRAQEWIDHNKAFLRLRSRIGAAEVLWREEGGPDRLLLPEGPGLKDAAALVAERGVELSAAELSYIDQSLALARRARHRRRARGLAAAVAGVIFTAAGGWYYWAFVMPVSAYYEDYEIRWGFPEGRSMVSADTASHRRLTYKLTRRGALGHVVKLESLNGYGKCVQNNDGDTPFGESADGDDYTSKVQCSVEFQENGGRLAREIARDRVGREIYTLDFVDWSQEKAQAQYWAGQRMRPETSGAAVIHYEFADQGSDAGLLTHEWFTDATNDPKPNKDGIFGFSYKYENGREVEVARLNKEGKPIDLNKKASLWRNSYDPKSGRIGGSTYYNSSGAKILGAGGYWRIEFSYDRFGNESDYDSYGRVSEYHYYDVEDAPMQPPLSAATIKVLYDQNGNRISRVNLDQDGNPVDLDGWAEWIDEFDRENRLVRSLYFNADGRPALGPEKYASVAYRYDREGNQSRAEYLGPDLKRVPGPDGYALGTWRYDDGRLRERRLYAPDSTSVRVRLDPQGHEVETEYLDADGRPRIDATLGCARVAKVYSPGGALLEVSYFNRENQLCVAEGLHYARVTWTQKDEKTWQAIFQDASGASTTNGSGAIMFLWTQSADGASGEGRHIKEDGSSLVVTMSGDLATEYRYYDKDGRASEDNASHALRVTFAYDTAKRLIERVLYHADGTRQHDRFDGDALVEMSFTDESGNPTDKNDFGVPRVGFAYDDNKHLLERVRYGADGVQEHERFSGGEVVEIDFTDADGKPTDKNERQAYRVTFEYAADGKETGHTDYRSDGLLAHWKFKGTDDEEVDWHDAGGTLVDGPLGYARCRFVKQQTACTDRAGHGLVSVIEIQGVVPDSVAEHSKLQTGDLLVSYDGTPVADMDAFVKQVAQPGSSPRILVVARDGRRLAFTVPPGRLGINIGHRYVRPVQLGSP